MKKVKAINKWFVWLSTNKAHKQDGKMADDWWDDRKIGKGVGGLWQINSAMYKEMQEHKVDKYMMMDQRGDKQKTDGNVLELIWVYYLLQSFNTIKEDRSLFFID